MNPPSGNAGSKETNIYEGSVQRRCQARERRDPVKFTSNPFARVRREDEPTVRSAISGEHRNEWHAAMQKEVSTLNDMGCWDVVSRPKDVTVLPTNTPLKRKRYDGGETKSYKVLLVVWGNREH